VSATHDPGWWNSAVRVYLVRLAPGTAKPSQLTALAVEPTTGFLAMALSASGRELAVASAAGTSGKVSAYSVSIYSVTTGRLLHAWTSATNVFGKYWDLYLTWVDGDRGIMFAADTMAGERGITGRETVRRLDVTAGGSDLAADSKVVWYTTRACSFPRISGDGSTIVCVSVPRASSSSSTMTATWLASSVKAPTNLRTLYKVPMSHFARGLAGADTLWVSPSGGTALIEEAMASPDSPGVFWLIGAISSGHFTPYPLALGDTPLLPSIAW
jgi:hypothetical protein